MFDKQVYLKAWQERAAIDFEAFRVLGTLKSPRIFEAASFHAQQAVEKWLKCLIQFHDQEPPRKHDLRTLLKVLSSNYPELNENAWLSKAEVLNGYSVDIRYFEDANPLQVPEFDKDEVAETLLAFRTFAKEKLGAHWVE